MDLFKYDDYKLFTNDWIEKRPKKGRGYYRKLSLFLEVKPVIISQVLKGERHFSLEQALEVCEFLALNELESDYFQLLVQREKAGTHKLKKRLQQKLNRLKEKANQVKARLPENEPLSDRARAEFYSQWFYSGIRLSTAIDGLNTPQDLSRHLNLPLHKVRSVLDFLVKNNLCLLEKNGTYRISEQSTHVDSRSPLVSRHHKNWREMAMRKMELQTEEDLFFTAPIVVNQQTMQLMRDQLLQTIQKLSKTATLSSSEQLICLNIDLFNL